MKEVRPVVELASRFIRKKRNCKQSFKFKVEQGYQISRDKPFEKE